jgi:(p)ppGpp synthase/HD superfamily hydrolase
MQALRPVAYEQLAGDVDSLLKESKTTISEFMHDTITLLSQHSIHVDDIEGRPKSLSSIRAKQAPDDSGRPSKVCTHPSFALIRVYVRCAM